MLSIQECREILESQGRTDMTDEQIEHLRYVCMKILNIYYRLTFGRETEVPPLPAALLRRGMSDR